MEPRRSQRNILLINHFIKEKYLAACHYLYRMDTLDVEALVRELLLSREKGNELFLPPLAVPNEF